MSDSIIIAGGTVVTPRGAVEADVLVRDGVVKTVAKNVLDVKARVIDAHGCWVMPGFVDLHTHLREPGKEEAETIETATRAAVLGGYTAVVAMPNTTPVTDNVETVAWVKKRASETALCEVSVASAITKGREGKELVDFDALAAAGVKIFTDDGSGVQSGELMREALLKAKELHVTIAEHCEDCVLANEGIMHAGDIANELGVTGQPAEAEEAMVMRDIALAREIDAPIHFLHLSTAKSVAMVREAKRAGANITSEATPHHFTLTHDELKSGNAVFKVNPPLRREQDRVSVVNGLRDDAIDAIATDHAPHAPAEKAKSLEDAPPGMLGLQTALALAITELDLGPRQLSALMSTNPARIAQLTDTQGTITEGRIANITVVDPEAAWVIEADQLVSKSTNSPFIGRKVTGRVLHTIVNGKLAVNNGEVQ